MKTTRFRHAATLTGDELVGVSRASYGTYQAPANQIQYKAYQSYVRFGGDTGSYAIGIGITLANESAVAIGHYTASWEPRSVGIGVYDYNGFYSVAVGNGVGVGDVCTAFGSHLNTTGQFNTVVGVNMHTILTGSVVIGYNFYNSETHCIGIGTGEWYGSPGEFEPGGSVIGSFNTAHADGGFAIGDQAHAHQRSVAIGGSAGAYAPHTVAIGNAAEAAAYYNYGTAIGAGSTAMGFGTAVGFQAQASTGALAVGHYASASIGYRIAIGNRSGSGQSQFTIGSSTYTPVTTAQQSMAIGSYGRRPLADGELVFGGAQAFGVGGMEPATRFQKFLAHTQGAIAASASWSSIGWTATFTYNTLGAGGNDYNLSFVNDAAADGPLTVSLSDTTITITVGTFEDGTPHPGKNQLGELATAVSANSDLDGFTFTYTAGFDAFNFLVFGLPVTIGFGGGQDAIDGVFQTGAFSSNVIPAIPHSAIATVYGRVTGTDQNLSVGYATFSLEPTLFFTDNAGAVTFINAPVFAVENGNELGLDWSVPVLTTDGSGLALHVDAPDNVGNTIIYWIAHLTFDASL